MGTQRPKDCRQHTLSSCRSPKCKKSNECDGDNERPNVRVLVTPLRVLSGPRVAVEGELSYWQQAPGSNQM